MHTRVALDIAGLPEQGRRSVVAALDEYGDDADALRAECSFGSGDQLTCVAALAMRWVYGEPVDPALAAVVGHDHGAGELIGDLEAEDGLHATFELPGQRLAAIPSTLPMGVQP